jgi:hypothetical protein
MIVKTKAKTRASEQRSRTTGRAPFWLKSVPQPSVPVEEKAMMVFQPDILIGSQFQSTFRRRFHLDPERVLMLAVLQDAVVCFQENVAATCKRKQLLHRDAETWILSGDTSYLFSFENVCDALGYDGAYLREGLMRWKRAALEHQSRKGSRRAAGQAAR